MFFDGPLNFFQHKTPLLFWQFLCKYCRMTTKKEKNFKHYFSTIYENPNKKGQAKRIKGKKVLDLAIEQVTEQLKKEKENEQKRDSDES